MPRKSRRRSKRFKGRRSGGRGGMSVQQTVQRGNTAVLRQPRYTIGRLPGIGLPDELHCTLQYAVQHIFTSTSGSSSVQDFRGNDCYDPDATSTGTQPAWFDALMTIYKYGSVKSSRLVANCKATTSANPGTIIVCPVNAQAELDASLLTNPMAAESLMSLNQPQFTFDMSMRSNDMAGLSSFEQYRASVNHWFTNAASPSGAHVWFWRLAYRATDGTSSTVLNVDTRIYYDVVLFNRNVSDEDFAADFGVKPKHVPELKVRDRERDGRRVIKTAYASHSVESPEPDPGDSKGLSATPPVATDAKERRSDAWSDVDDTDEPDYARFLAWKRASQPAGVSETPRRENRDNKARGEDSKGKSVSGTAALGSLAAATPLVKP